MIFTVRHHLRNCTLLSLLKHFTWSRRRTRNRRRWPGQICRLRSKHHNRETDIGDNEQKSPIRKRACGKGHFNDSYSKVEQFRASVQIERLHNRLLFCSDPSWFLSNDSLKFDRITCWKLLETVGSTRVHASLIWPTTNM